MLIFLIGYMGSGKTTLGKLLAERLGCRFIDMDSRFVEAEGISIPEFFRSRGEEAFRKAEHEVLIALIRGKDTVVATGGGTPCFFDNMEMMNAAGITIYFKVSPDELFERLKDDAALRPMLRDVIPGGLKAFIDGHLKDRERYYLKAKIVWDSGVPSTDGLTEQILRLSMRQDSF